MIGDEWDGLDAKSVVLDITNVTDALNLRINSPGGFVTEGLAIYGAVMRARAAGVKVTCYIDGIAASMASVIAMAGDEIVMAENALMMIHNPSASAFGVADELRAVADQLDLLRDQCVSIYAKQTGLDADTLKSMLDAETWFTADQALAQKFCTSIDGASTATALNVTAFGFRKAPETPRISATAMLGKPKAQRAAPQRPLETKMNLYTTRAALVAAIAKFQSDGGTQAEIDKIAQSAIALDAKDALPATGALALAVADPAPAVVTPPVASATGLTQTDVQAAIAADRQRGASIRALGMKHKLDAPFVEAIASSGDSLDVAREKMLDKLAERGDAQNIGNTAITITADARDKWLDGATAWLLTRAGVSGTVAKAAAMRGEKIDLNPGEFRGVSCVELARESLMHSGVKLATRDPKTIVGAAFTARGEITQTTGDFSVLLENVMHKTVQATYAVTPDTWSQFCGVGTVTDFRVANRYLRGTFGALDNVNEAGEFKNKPIPDGAKQTIQAGTKGNIINLSRQAIINDDMGVFSDLATELGRAAKLTIEIDVYALLNSNPTMFDGQPLFSAAHGNVAAVSAPPGVVSFDAARVQMASQKDVSGNEFLEIRPNVWLGPLGIGGAARIIVGSPYDPDATNKLQRPNIVQGLVSTIVDTPRLTGTAWYMFADKDMAPAIEVVFLNGVQEPFLDNELGWRVDGTEWKVRLDYGVGAVNWRSAIKNGGA